MKQEFVYSKEPKNTRQFTKKFDHIYTVVATMYDKFVKWTPTWKRWITQVIPHIEGPRVLEVSFGTGYLLSQYAGQFETYGLDYNARLIAVTKQNLGQKELPARLVRGNVESLPYRDNTFDNIVNTMAFTAYPDSQKAMSELHRVLKPGGKLLMIDFNFPKNQNRVGMIFTRFMEHLGDIIRDMDALFTQFDFDYTDQKIGGFGSVHLYVAQKK